MVRPFSCRPFRKKNRRRLATFYTTFAFFSVGDGVCLKRWPRRATNRFPRQVFLGVALAPDKEWDTLSARLFFAPSAVRLPPGLAAFTG
jgi:hypothetical protein